MCSVYMESDPVQKLGSEGSWIWKKNCDKTKTEGFKFGNNLPQPEPKEPSHKFFKTSEPDRRFSFKKEEPHNTGHYLFTLLTTLFFWEFFGGKKCFQISFCIFLFFGDLQISSLFFSLFLGFQIPLFYFIFGLEFSIFFFPLFLASKFHYWFFSFCLAFKFPYFYFLLPNFLRLFFFLLANFLFFF
jgi:hypothetical protein